MEYGDPVRFIIRDGGPMGVCAFDLTVSDLSGEDPFYCSGPVRVLAIRLFRFEKPSSVCTDLPSYGSN